MIGCCGAPRAAFLTIRTLLSLSSWMLSLSLLTLEKCEPFVGLPWCDLKDFRTDDVFRHKRIIVNQSLKIGWRDIVRQNRTS
jgi:hypothetical protein